MIIVSACFCNINCKYNGLNNYNDEINKLVIDGKAIPVCPEVLGQLPIPRIPCEIVKQKDGKIAVINKNKENVTNNFLTGAEKTLKIAQAVEAKVAILKSKSPSCGCGKIYDGTFTSTLIEGNGITAELLKKNNIKVYNEETFKTDWSEI